MKTYFSKYRILFLALLMMCCVIPQTVHAEENHSHCYPTEEQIEAYKKDGTWEKRQEYVKKLNYTSPSQELLDKAIQRENGIVMYGSGNYIPEEWKDMPVSGEAKMLLVRVEFADIKFVDSKIYSEEEFYGMVMGNDSSGAFPYESLNAFYDRSSYGKLNITSNQVYNCTLAKERCEYEGQELGEQDLIAEVLEQLDNTVDFTDYDADKDGYIDSICVNFAGDNTGWGSTWWSHKCKFLNSSISFDGVTPAGYVFLETMESDITYGTQTLIHETGHLLGLPDYYGVTGDGIGTTDMMNNNTGDHNGFSKWLLGWLEKENILKIHRMNGDIDVQLVPLASESLEDKKIIAVIAPEESSIYSEYFVVQYDEYMGNQSITELGNPGYRIYHLNAQLNDEGTDFKYGNMYANEKSLIKSVSIIEDEYNFRTYFVEGDEFTPDTNESSAFTGGNILGFTGIELTDFKTGESPSFHVSFREKGEVDGNVEFDVVSETPLNIGEITLLSNKPLIDADSDKEPYLEDSEENRYPLSLELEDGTQQISLIYDNVEKSLEPETEYTLVIPEGIFQIDADVYSEEYRTTVKTGKFPKIVASFSHGSYSPSNMFSVNDDMAGFIQCKSSTEEHWVTELHLYEGMEEVAVKEIQLPIPEYYTEISTVDVIPLYDGTIALKVNAFNLDSYDSVYCYYKVDLDGNVLAGSFEVYEDLTVFASGNGLKGVSGGTGALGAPDLDRESKMEIYTIDFKNEPTSCLINASKFSGKSYLLDKDSYIVVHYTDEGDAAEIFSSEDEYLTSIDLNGYIKGYVVGVVKSGEDLVIMQIAYSDNDQYVVSANIFSMDGTYKETKEVLKYNGWKEYEGWELEKTNWGYCLSHSSNSSFYISYLINDSLEVFSAMQLPSGLSDSAVMGTRLAVKWYDITLPGYKTAITEPVVEVDSEDDSTTDDSTTDDSTTDDSATDDSTTDDSATDDSATDDSTTDDSTTEEPPVEEENKDDDVLEKPDSNSSNEQDVPDTGDGSNVWLMLLLILASGRVVVESFKRKAR